MNDVPVDYFQMHSEHLPGGMMTIMTNLSQKCQLHGIENLTQDLPNMKQEF
jgi:hypothetical protein